MVAGSFHTHTPRNGRLPVGGVFRPVDYTEGCARFTGCPIETYGLAQPVQKIGPVFTRGSGGYPPLVETVLRLPPGGPWTSGRDPRGDPPPPRGEGGVPSGVLSDDRAGGYPGGGTPGGSPGPQNWGVPGGVQKCTKYLPKKRKLIVRLFGRTFGAKRGFRTPPDFPENSAQFSCLKFGARILH